MGKIKDMDLQLAEDISHLFNKLECGWLSAELYGIDMLKEMKKFVDSKAHLLNMVSQPDELKNKEA
jgi:hypothetical protein